MMRKFFLTTALAALAFLPVVAQSMTSEEYNRRYETLVGRVGSSGLGVENLLDKWEADHPNDIDMLQARFLYCFDKSGKPDLVLKNQSKFLGEAPMLALKDSLGNDVNYFQEVFYDDELFGQAVTYIDKAIQQEPNRLDLRLNKITALIGYEKESPDMALAEIKSLIDYNATLKPNWTYPGYEVTKDYFNASVQEYCYAFFSYGTPRSYDAFRDISLKMLDSEPNNTLFLNNMGSYFLVSQHDNKTAQKYYDKVLKIDKGDLTAIRNCILMARNAKDTKLEKKYLPMLAKYGETEADKASAQARLDALNTKKK